VKTDNTSIEFVGLANRNGYLGKLRSEPFEAQDLEGARRMVYQLMMSILSNTALELDIPMHVYQIETTEVRTGTILRNLMFPHWDSPTRPRLAPVLEQDFRIYASMYREALSSNSSVYRFLCLFKIIEAIFARRVRLAREARRKGESFSRAPEMIPENPDARVAWLNGIFLVPRDWHPLALEAIFVEKSIGRDVPFIRKEFLAPLRDRVAHALYGRSGELPMFADEALHVDEIDYWLPLTKCIVRRMIKNEFPDLFLSEASATRDPGPSAAVTSASAQLRRK
jgi:hypothetical protein